MTMYSILIADDDQNIVEAMKIHCRRLGFRVATAHDAMTALRTAEADPPDVVILDVNMPQGNGLCVREMMAYHDALGTIPVIILTASSSEDTIRRCYEQISYYILKSPDCWSRVEPVLLDLFPDLPSEDDCRLRRDTISKSQLSETSLS